MLRCFYVLVLMLVSAAAFACDWEVSKEADPMTDVVTCTVYSPTAKIAFYRDGADAANVSVSSAYRQPFITVRIDGNEAIRMGQNARDRQPALFKLRHQLETGVRLRVRFSDYPKWQDGDAPICNLPQLLADCKS